MQVTHRVDGAEVEVFAEHERLAQRLQLVVPAAGQRARLDPGIAFPLAALGEEVVFQHVETDRQRAAVAIRAQPHVDPEHEAVGGHFGQQFDHLAAQPREEIEIVDALAEPVGRVGIGFTAFRIDEDEIDVGTDVQLAPAQFAHADADEGLHGAGAAVFRFATRLAETRNERNARLIGRYAHRQFGQQRHALGDFVQIGQARQIAHDQMGHRAGTQVAQRALDAGFVGRFERRLRQPVFEHSRTGMRLQGVGQRVDQRRSGIEQAIKVATVPSGVGNGGGCVHGSSLRSVTKRPGSAHAPGPVHRPAGRLARLL